MEHLQILFQVRRDFAVYDRPRRQLHYVLPGVNDLRVRGTAINEIPDYNFLQPDH